MANEDELLGFFVVSRGEQQSRNTSTIDEMSERSRPHVLFCLVLVELHNLNISERAWLF